MLLFLLHYLFLLYVFKITGVPQYAYIKTDYSTYLTASNELWWLASFFEFSKYFWN